MFHNAVTEASLIRGLMSGGKLREKITPNDFVTYRDVFEVALQLISEKRMPDFTAISSRYPDITKLIECVQSDGRAALVDEYAKTLKELTQRRNTLDILRNAERTLEDSTNDVRAIVSVMRDQLLSVSKDKSSWTSSKDVIAATTAYLNERIQGDIPCIATGLPNVDSIIGGFFGGELTVIGARPAVGKSAFALNIAYQAALKGYSVGIISREMTDTQLGSRLISRASNVSGMHLRTATLSEDEWTSINAAAELLNELDINYLFGVKTVEDLRTQVQARAEIKPLDILIVDYLQLMGTDEQTNQEHLRIGRISKALKDISVDYHIPVIALAQVNRDTDGQMPQLKSLKDSGSIEQDADGVIFLHRPVSVDDETIIPQDRSSVLNWKQKGLDYIVIQIAKQRQGNIGKTAVLFDKAHMDYLQIQR